MNRWNRLNTIYLFILNKKHQKQKLIVISLNKNNKIHFLMTWKRQGIFHHREKTMTISIHFFVFCVWFVYASGWWFECFGHQEKISSSWFQKIGAHQTCLRQPSIKTESTRKSNNFFGAGSVTLGVVLIAAMWFSCKT